MQPLRIEGYVEHLNERATFGFIRGDDGKQYFFIPSYLMPPNERRIASVSVGARVSFEPFSNTKGERARGIRNIGVRQG